MAEFYRVREAFAFTDHKGVPRVYSAGQLLSADDPDLKGRLQFCEPVAAYVARATETATAAPGEVRSVVRKAPAKKAAKLDPEGES